MYIASIPDYSSDPDTDEPSGHDTGIEEVEGLDGLAGMFQGFM